MNTSGTRNTYNSNVRIGNWNEDQELLQEKLKDYSRKKECGQLLVHQVQEKLNHALVEVSLTYSKDGYIHIGDHIMLYSVQTEGVLSVDTSTQVSSSDVAWAVTASTLTQAPVARNVFVVEAVEPGAKVGDLLRLAEKFRLRCNPMMSTSNSYLLSQPISPLSFSRVSRNQEVSVGERNSFDNVWTIQHKNVDQRFEMEGSPVPCNAEIVLVHCGTQNALAADKLDQHNDFGREYEVSARSYCSIKKKQGLYQEQLGLTTSDIPVRSQKSQNYWAVLTASTPELDPNYQPEHGNF